MSVQLTAFDVGELVFRLVIDSAHNVSVERLRVVSCGPRRVACVGDYPNAPVVFHFYNRLRRSERDARTLGEAMARWEADE